MKWSGASLATGRRGLEGCGKTAAAAAGQRAVEGGGRSMAQEPMATSATRTLFATRAERRAVVPSVVLLPLLREGSRGWQTSTAF